jgi:pimeloyl-ACP methyl ester carboxylesterase
MFAHGYELPGSTPRPSQNPAFARRMQPFLQRGFAIAASDYPDQGFGLPQAVEDTETLRTYFIENYGQPDSVFMIGFSMGGGVSLAMMENFSDAYSGALPFCPLSSRPYLQTRKEFDLYATFNGIFPGLIKSLHEIFDIKGDYKAFEQSEMFDLATHIKQQIVDQDSSFGAALAENYALSLDDLPFTLLFAERVLRDIAEKSGGNPYDNTTTVYSGFPDDLHVNQKAERLNATVDPESIFGKYDRTGDIGKPVLLVHTIYDQLIPPVYGVTNFENMIHHQRKSGLFSVKYTDGKGHCNFTPTQIGESFDQLRHWVNTGNKPKSGYLE